MEIFAIIMFFISFYGLISAKSIIKSVVSIAIMEMAVIMFFLGVGYTNGAIPPIGADMDAASAAAYADPLPQALMITAIVIGVVVSAVNLVILISLYSQYKTTDWDEARNVSRAGAKVPPQ